MKILFIVFPQRSHLNATLPLAADLAAEGHEIVYSACPELRAPVEAHGFEFAARQRDVYPFVERAPAQLRRPRASVVRWLLARRQLDAYRRARRETGDLTGIVATLRPDIVLVDRAYTVFCPPLFSTGIPFGILVSMGNLNHAPGFPPQDTCMVPSRTRASRYWAEFQWQRYFVERRLNEWMSLRMEFDRRFLRQVEADCTRPRFRFDTDRYFHPGIRDVPEFLLFPRAFDFPRPLAPNQYHVESIRGAKRTDGAVDLAFAKSWKRLCAERQDGTPIVYCSFGSASWRYPSANSVFRLLIALANDVPWNLVIAADTAARELRSLLPSRNNVLLCEMVPQVEVLEQTDVMICHGGMNSIVEAILAGVPLLVCPGMRRSDQPGNAARVCFHGLGVPFNPGEGRTRLRTKIATLIADPRYRQRSDALRSEVLGTSERRRPGQVVIEALTKHWQNSPQAVRGA